MAARRTRQISIKECYDILGIQKGADLQTVKTAYRRKAFELHPDLNPGNAEASHQFQLLNEAYVALSAVLKPQEEAKQKARQATEEKERKSGEQQENKTGKDSARASAAYAEQDVLRDLLNDPFAKRVFEDIYRELNRQQANQKPEEPPLSQPEKPASKPTFTREPEKAQTLPISNKNQDKSVTGVVKDWLRKQIDEEQTLAMPAARLGPGAKIRLQIRKGLSEDVTAVDVTLPSDFAIGKPMRLRGLGKRVGPWQGDLYLTIITQ